MSAERWAIVAGIGAALLLLVFRLLVEDGRDVLRGQGRSL